MKMRWHKNRSMQTKSGTVLCRIGEEPPCGHPVNQPPLTLFENCWKRTVGDQKITVWISKQT